MSIAYTPLKSLTFHIDHQVIGSEGSATSAGNTAKAGLDTASVSHPYQLASSFYVPKVEKIKDTLNTKL